MATREELLAELNQLRNNEKVLLQTELSQLQQQESTLSANKPYNFGSAFGQFASGGMEGLGELTGMIGDAAEASPYLNPITAAMQYPIDKLMGALGVQAPDRFSMDNAKKIRDVVTENVQPYDPKYRYSRKAGEFVVPGLATAPLSGAGYLRSAITDIAGALGAQGTKDMGYGEVGQLVGTVGAAGLTDLGISGAKSLKRNLLGLSQPEIDASAAYVLKELGLTSEQVDKAIKTLPQDELAKYATLAEVTQNPNVAKVQQEYTSGVGPGASRWQGLEKDRARLRDSVLANLSTETPPNPEGFGRQIIDAVSENKRGLQEEAKNIWQKFPRGKPVNTNALKRKVMSELSSRQGGGYKSSGFVHPKVKELTDQILEAGENMTTGQLQDIRSRALTLKREVKLDGRDIGLLDDIQGGVIKSIEGGLGATRNLPDALTPQDEQIWKAGRDLTSEIEKTFGGRTLGSKILRPDARESKILDKVLDGDASTIKEFKKLVKNDPTIIEKAKAGVVDKIPRAAGNLLTPAKLETFIKQNRRGLKELYGTDGIRTMERVLGDLQSQTNIGNMARGASKGGSDTAVRLNTLSEIRSMVGSRGKTRWPIVGEKLDALTKGAKENARKKIDSLILESMFDPQFARDLLKTPTQSRVLSIVDRLLETAESMGVAAARPGVLEFFNGERPTGGSNISINEADTYPTAGGEAYGGGGAGGNPAGKVPEPVPQATPTPITLTRQQLRSDPKALKTYVKSLDPVLQAIINVESRGNPKAVSHAGAKGIMQLMPRNLRVFGVKDPFDPYESIQAGIKLLNEEVGRFGGDIKLVLAAYNAGSPAVNRAIKKAGSKSWSAIYPHLPAETKKYVPKVLNELRKMEA